MSKKRPPGHLSGPSLKLPVPGSLSQVATSLQDREIFQNLVLLLSIGSLVSVPGSLSQVATSLKTSGQSTKSRNILEFGFISFASFALGSQVSQGLLGLLILLGSLVSIGSQVYLGSLGLQVYLARLLIGETCLQSPPASSRKNSPWFR